MSKYKVSVYWTVWAEVKVEASSPEQAEMKLHESEKKLPPGEYVTDSFEVGRIMELL